MRHAEIISLITRIERDFPVNQWELEGIRIWPYIRVQIGFLLIDQRSHPHHQVFWSYQNLLQISKRVSVLCSQGIRFLWAMVFDFKKNIFRLHHADILFLTMPVNRTKIGSSFVNRLIDPFIDVFEKNSMDSLVLEYSPTNELLVPRFRKSLIIQFNLLWILINFKISKIWKRTNTDISLSRYDEFLSVLKKEGHTLPDLEYYALHDHVILLNRCSLYFSRMLKKVKPRVIITTEYFDMISMALNLACRRANIKSAEIQHGIQHEYHHAYGHWTKIPTEGYELLPSKFIVWSQSEADIINQWAHHASRFHSPVVSGNLWLDKWLRNDDAEVQYFDRVISNIRERYNNKKTVLISLQDKLPEEWILQVIKKTGKQYLWWIRLHPVWKKNRETLLKLLKFYDINLYDVDIITELPLPALLRHTDIHLTRLSAVVIDAAQFGVPSICTDPDAATTFPKEFSSGIALFAQTPEELLLLLNTRKKKPPLTPRSNDDNIIKQLLA